MSRRYRSSQIGTGHLAQWPSAWSDSQRGELAISAWKAGKRSLGDRVAGEARAAILARASQSATQNLTPLEMYWAVRHVEDLDLDDAVIEAWPYPDSELHGLIADAARGGKHLQALMYLEKDGEPPRSGFEGERGLAYAYVLARRKYYRHAMAQIEGLEAGGDPTIREALVFRLLAGYVRSKRRRYEDAFASYLEAGRGLLE